MYALIGEFAAAREFGIAAPLFFVARAPTVTVASACVDERADRARCETFVRFGDRRMIAMIEADLHDAFRLARRVRQETRFTATRT